MSQKNLAQALTADLRDSQTISVLGFRRTLLLNSDSATGREVDYTNRRLLMSYRETKKAVPRDGFAYVIRVLAGLSSRDRKTYVDRMHSSLRIAINVDSISCQRPDLRHDW
ncbi:hypothetical protein BCAR13_1140020 [Paraburkholderia caribensis]|nr:hypothetical protein BCAR13_1140020 [Paraburkholderia caribensis]